MGKKKMAAGPSWPDEHKHLTSYPLEDSSGASEQHHLPQEEFLPDGDHHPQSAPLR